MNRKSRRHSAKLEKARLGSKAAAARSPSQIFDDKLRCSIDAAEVVLKRIKDEVVKEGTPETIFHYTDYIGLRGILENREIWLSSIFRMNDPSELRHGVEPMISIVQEFSNSKGSVVKAFARFFSQVLRGNIEQTGVYLIASFSKNGDELGQWRAYADDGRGYAIGFDASALEASLSKKGDGGIATASFLVDYSDERLKARQKEIFSAFAPTLIALESGNFTREEIEEYGRKISVELSLATLQISTFHKHKGYESEGEYRFLLLNSSGQIGNQLKHRMRRDQIVPYLPFSWRDINPTPLRQIRFGPSCNPSSCATFIQDCLRLSNFSQGVIGITKSDIPYRSRFNI